MSVDDRERVDEFTERLVERERWEHDLSEDDLALRLVEQYPDARWVDPWGRWLTWNGELWIEERTRHQYHRIRTMCRQIAEDLNDKKVQSRLRKAATISAIENMSRTDRRYAATIDQWDTDDWLLNTPDGILHLREGTTRPHDPMCYITKITAVSPSGECPRWHQFLEEITSGNAELIAFLQRFIGYCLTGSTREHVLAFFYGTGANGKGTFLNTVRYILADYAKVAPIETFSASHTDRHPTELAMLRGARVVFAQETEQGRHWAESRIKSLTGGDPVTARFMRQDFFEYVPQFKLLLAGNHKPALKSVDEAIRRRFLLFPLTVTIPERQRDPDLAEKLKAEWPGILAWGVDGCRQYLQRGLDVPHVVREATDAYMDAEDEFAAWIEDCCDTGPDYWEKPATLFKSWKHWAEGNGAEVGSDKALAKQLESHGFTSHRQGARGRHWRGLCLRPRARGVA